MFSDSDGMSNNAVVIMEYVGRHNLLSIIRQRPDTVTEEFQLRYEDQ